MKDIWDQPSEKIDCWDIEKYGENDEMYEGWNDAYYIDCYGCEYWENEGAANCNYPDFCIEKIRGDSCPFERQGGYFEKL